MINTLVTFLKKPTTRVYFASLLLLLLGLALTYRIRPFTSDDSFWQTILLNGWLPFHHSIVSLGNSSIHIDKLPLYQFFNAIATPSRKVLFIESAIIAIASLTAFYWSCVYLLKNIAGKAKLTYATLLPFLWVVGLGYAFLSLYLDPDWRSFEISFSFVIFSLTYALWRGKIKIQSPRSFVLLILFTAYVGLLIYGDPYILYFALAPLAVFTVVIYFPLRRLNRRLAIMTFVAVLASAVFSKLFALIAIHAGITIQIKYDYLAFVDFSQLGNNIAQTIQSLLAIFGADFFGMHLGIGLAAPLISFIVLCLVAYAIYKITPRMRADLNLNALWMLFFTLVLIFSVAFYMLTNMNQGILTYRYLLFSVLLCAMPFSYFLTTLRGKLSLSIVCALLVLSTILNIGGIIGTKTDNRANADNYQVIAMLKGLGYTKGYAGYWDANIDSYLSSGAVRVLPSLCTGPKMTQWQWLINDDAFRIKAGKSFYIYNPNAPWPILTQTNICDNATLTKQFGEPIRKLAYKQEIIYLYDYDISDRL